MGKMQRDKGARIEREMVNLHKSKGLHSERVPLSGAVKGRRIGQGHDIDVYIGKDRAPLCGEIKGRRKLPKYLNEWLGDNDFLILKEDRADIMVVLPPRVWFELLRGYRG